MTNERPIIGFIGLGVMGGPMSRNLIAAGYTVYAFDLDADALAATVDAGGKIAASTPDAVSKCDVIITSLPRSHVTVAVTESEILPNVRAGQIWIDLGTTLLSETRRLSALFAERGAATLDVPVSGGGGGAEKAVLYMFAGGDKDIFERCLPILEVLGGDDRITYCGPVGSGQAVKGVNQLMQGLVNAAHLEAIAFGVLNGIDSAVVEQALGYEGRWRPDFHGTASRVAAGEGVHVNTKYHELPYFVGEAKKAGFELPIAERVQELCEKLGEAEGVVFRGMEAKSYWRALERLAEEA